WSRRSRHSAWRRSSCRRRRSPSPSSIRPCSSCSRRSSCSGCELVEFLEAALTVLREEGRPLHWTVIQDLALQRGYLDPFTQRDIRKHLLAALAGASKAGTLVRPGIGVFALPDQAPSPGR